MYCGLSILYHSQCPHKSFEGILNNDDIGVSKDEQLVFEKELYSMQSNLVNYLKVN